MPTPSKFSPKKKTLQPLLLGEIWCKVKNKFILVQYYSITKIHPTIPQKINLASLKSRSKSINSKKSFTNSREYTKKK